MKNVETKVRGNIGIGHTADGCGTSSDIVSSVATPPSEVRNDEGAHEATRKLLDVISSIIADEYIKIAKENKDVFGIASAASQSRNDEGKHGGLE